MEVKSAIGRQMQRSPTISSDGFFLRSKGTSMKSRIEGEWTGWSGDTVVKLVDGSMWRQEQYYYRYQYRYRPTVMVERNMMLVEGMPKAVRVRRID